MRLMERATAGEIHELRCAWGLWLAITLVVLAMTLAGSKRSVTTSYRQAAQQWLAGGPMYNDDGAGFLYLPSAAVLFVPFALLPDSAGEVLWRVLTIGTFAAGVWRLVQCSNSGRLSRRFLLVT